MKPDFALKKNKRRLLGSSIGLFLFAVYLLVYRGGFHSVDEVSIFAVTESLVKFGLFNTDQIAWTQWTTSQAEAQGFFGRDGHVYSKKGLALSLGQAPLYWLALYLPGLGMLQTVSLLNALITAVSGLLIFMFLQRLGFSIRTAGVVSLIFGLATIAFVYAKYLFSEPLAGLLLLLAAYMLFTYRQEGGLHHLVIAGLASGFAILTRANNLFLLPVFSLYLLWSSYTEMKRQSGKAANLLPLALRQHLFTTSLLPLVIFGLTVGLVGLVLMGYNAVRSGNALQTGYDLTLFSPNVLSGLYKLLFSPLRGFFIYSPILILSLPGWWRLHKTYPAEAWLFAGLSGVTLILFSAWSSGEGLSWGSRFLVPIVPFFAICLAPLVEEVFDIPHPPFRIMFYLFLPLSFLIQLLGVAINPWVFLAQLQAEFGGEFFLENTAALYDFRYSQIIGQIRAWSSQNSDIIWWQPWGFDGLAFSVSLGLVLLSGWLLWRQMTLDHGPPPAEKALSPHTLHIKHYAPHSTRLLTSSPLPLSILTLVLTFFLLARYYNTDRQFGPPDDPYVQALDAAAAQASPTDHIVTVAPYHYHVPMNRFKARLPITGLAQQAWPLAETTVRLLKNVAAGQNIWLVTVGVSPAAAENAPEQWLAFNTFAANDNWFDDVRLVRFGAQWPSVTRSINATLGREVRLVEVKLAEPLQPGQTLPVKFIWQTLQQPQTNYTLFLQLLGAGGMVMAQHDSPPNGGYSPTSSWLPGQQWVSRHALALPRDLPAGTYQLIAGLYNPATGQRLAVDQKSDFVALGQVTVNFQRSNK